MSNLVFRLPRYYQDSPQVSELERVLGEQAGALRVSESDTLAQLWVDTATWGLDLWEQWVGLPSDRTRPYSYRRSRIKAKLRGQGATTAEMLRSVVASFGFEPSQISVIEHPAEYQFEIVLSDLAAVPSDVSGIESAVNEIKPAHLDYWFTYELAQLLAALLDPVAQATSTQPEVAGGQLSMLVEYRNDMGGGLEEGFTLSEFGVMAKVGDDAPTLLYYAALGDPAQPVPPIAEGLDVHRFPVAIGVTGEVEVSLEYPAGVWVTHEELEEALAGIDLSGYIKATEKGQPGGVATLGPDGKVPGEQLPKMDYDPAGSAEAVQKNLTAHTGNKNNPHAVTAEQVGALASSGGVMSGAISMSGHKIANLAAPADSTDAANKQYVDEQVGASRAVKGTYPVAAGQSIQAGDVVDVVEGQVQKSATPVANVETVVNAGAVDCMAACDLNSEYAVVAEAASSGNNHDAHLISKKTGKNVSETVYFNGDTISSLALARLSDTQFVVGFASSQNVFLSVGTVSGESINLGSRYTLMALQSGWNCDICIVPFSENQAFVVTCNGSNNYPSGSILSISGSTITKGAWTHPDGVGRPGVMSAARLPDSDGKKRVCVCFNDVNDGNKGKAVIATIDSSNVVTWGSVVTIVPSVVNGTSCASVGSVIYVVVHTIVYILNDNLSVLGQGKYDTNTYSETRLTLTSFDNFAVGTYFGKNNTDAAVIRWDGEKVSISEPYSFSPVGYANYISTARISNDRMIVAYQSAGSGNYGTTTILTVSGNQIAGSFIDGSQDAIALKSGTAGQSIEVIYSGTVAADWVTEGQVVDSPGVYGAGVLAGVLQVWSKERPVGTKIVTGSYVGTGTYGSGNRNRLVFPSQPKVIFISGALRESNNSFVRNGMAVMYSGVSDYVSTLGMTYASSAKNTNDATITWSGNEVSWWTSPSSSDASYTQYAQLNGNGITYHYTAIL